MLENMKSLFDIPSDICYLNSAAQSPMLRTAKIAGEKGLAIKSNPWTLDPDYWNDRANDLRALLADLISAEAKDVALIPSTAYGAATAAHNLYLEAGQNIVLLEGQYPSNVIAWEKKARENGGSLNTVSRPDDYNWTPHILEAITDKTGIVTLPPCHWTDGSKIDLVAVGERCRKVGAALVVDATQAVGAMMIDVRAIQPDFLICSSYKWLLSPVGSAFIYSSPKHHQGLPIEFSKFNCDEVDAALGVYAPKAGGNRYEMGGRNVFIQLPMALESAKQIFQWGPENIQNTLRPLTDLVEKMALDRGWKVPIGDYRIGHIIGLTLPQGSGDKLAQKLAAENIFVSERGGGLRVSPYLFNDTADIEKLFAVLDRLVER